ncbi:MAG TPA: class I SAM-dependent methyltransferase [Terracidiphilus sp.]|nr:class I SAM-dependent methyltransferase [Terracidiphilus sp.]
MFNTLLHMLDRTARRIAEIPRRGLPELRPHPSTFDEEFGVETDRMVWLTNPAAKNYAHGGRYQGCNPVSCRWLIDTSKIDTKDYWFVDIGCGKGRAMLVASRYEFPRLVGVEYSARLCRIARSNLHKCNVPDSRFEISCSDATEFRFPDQDLFVFFYNPFDATILRTVLENLRSVSGNYFVGYEGPGRGELEKYDWLSLAATGPNVVLYAKRQ